MAWDPEQYARFEEQRTRPFHSRGLEVRMWETTYFHPMGGAEGIVEWLKGTTLRPALECPGEQSDAFLTALTREVHIACGASKADPILFPFSRLFLVATRRRP